MSLITPTVSSLPGAEQYLGDVLTGMVWDDASQSYIVALDLTTFRVKITDWVIPLDTSYLVLTDSQYQIFEDIIVNQRTVEAFQYTGQAGLYYVTDGMIWDPSKGCHTLTQETATYRVTPGAYIITFNDSYRHTTLQDFEQEFLVCFNSVEYNYLFT
jgi:hypothetical protein